MSEQPATSAGKTEAAGADVSDQEFSEEVADNTDPNLKTEDVFERESGGAATDTEAAKATGDELK